MYLLSNIRIINIKFCPIRIFIRYKSYKSNHIHRWSRILRSHSLHDNQDEVNEHDLTKTHNVSILIMLLLSNNVTLI